jgi:hypothetical protein
MLSTPQPFSASTVNSAPVAGGIYVVYDLFGPIYVGRSRLSLRDRMLLHFGGNGNRNFRLATAIGTRSQMSYTYHVGVEQPGEAERRLETDLGPAAAASLRQERDPADWL